MNTDDSFIARWSRRKQQAAEEKQKPRAGTGKDEHRAPHTGAVPAASEGRGRLPGLPAAAPDDVEQAFDPATLPPIETIVAGTDIRAFLRTGVPAALTKAALRRAWTADPAIRDFIEVAENQWDFTDPAAIPGFGPLQATDNLRQLVGQALGNLPEAPTDAPADAPDATAASIPQECSDATVSDPQAAVPGAPPSEARAPRGDPQADASAMRTQAASLPQRGGTPDTERIAAPQHPTPAQEVGNAPRRRGHGRALPRWDP
jgi:hypothetical protein